MTHRPFWIGTGWKMNMTQGKTMTYVARLQALLPPARDDVSVFIVPPFTALATARRALDVPGMPPVLLGAQNMHWAESGAYTGEISAAMLNDIGTDLVELGHSERRSAFGETDETVNLKVKAVLANGMRPLVCVGDTAAEHHAGASVETIVRQVKMAFADITPEQLARCLVAYEPIWAIGDHGVPAEPLFVVEAHRVIRQALCERTSAPVPILYGGSVNQANALDFSRESEIDGLFIGRSAWSAEGLANIVVTAVDMRRKVGLLP